MKKHILAAATAALLAWPALPSGVLAAPPEAPGTSGMHHPHGSPEDFAAFPDARIRSAESGPEANTRAREELTCSRLGATRASGSTRQAHGRMVRKAKEPREHRL